MFYLDTLWFVQARAVSTDGLRPGFFTINAVVYVVQVYIFTCNLQDICEFSRKVIILFLWGRVMGIVLLSDCSLVGFVVEACSSYGYPIKDVLCW